MTEFLLLLFSEQLKLQFPEQSSPSQAAENPT
jgi:hypothetical protein